MGVGVLVPSNWADEFPRNPYGGECQSTVPEESLLRAALSQVQACESNWRSAFSVASMSLPSMIRVFSSIRIYLTRWGYRLILSKTLGKFVRGTYPFDLAQESDPANQ